MGENTVTVITDQGDVTVKKLAVGDYAQFFKGLNKLPTTLGQLMERGQINADMDSSQILVAVSAVLAESLDEVIGLLVLATDKDAEFIKQVDAAAASEIILKAIKLNNYKALLSNLKKAWAQFQPDPPASLPQPPTSGPKTPTTPGS